MILKVLLAIIAFLILIYVVFTGKALIEYKQNYQDCESIYSGQANEATPSPEELCEQSNEVLKWKIYHPFGNYFDYKSPLL